MCAGLQDALQKAPSASRRRQDRVVESVHRTGRRRSSGREEVSRAQEVLTSAWAKLQSEEHGLADEARLATELSWTPEDTTRLVPIRQTAIPSCSNGAHPGPSLPRGRRHSEVQRETAGHERQRERH